MLVQCKEELIERTFESIRGCPRAIVHLYNSTSPAQRRITFGIDKQGVVDIAVRGTKQIKERIKSVPGTKIRFEYSPESFSATETDFALEVCEAVGEVWGYTETDPIIFNLPNTVELMMPNQHADQIEWFITHQKYPKRAIISLHTHNDRGTGIAASELGLLAGATRVEGTLFGNGERTGNVDIVTLALNMFTQGVDPKLDFSKLRDVRDLYERCTKLDVPLRQPYGGDLVFTAFSGSHQDAINKGLKDRTVHPDGPWEVPYHIPIDPRDIGRNYRAIIRINSQSGKGGVAYVMEQEFGYVLPKAMHRDFGKIVNRVADERGEELPPADILEFVQGGIPGSRAAAQAGEFRGSSEGEGNRVRGEDREERESRRRSRARATDRSRPSCARALLLLWSRAVRGRFLFRALARQRCRGQSRGLLRDQVGRGPVDLRRGD